MIFALLHIWDIIHIRLPSFKNYSFLTRFWNILKLVSLYHEISRYSYIWNIWNIILWYIYHVYGDFWEANSMSKMSNGNSLHFPLSWFSTDRHMGCVLSHVSLRRWIRIAEESAFVLNTLGAGKYTGRLFLHCTHIARICTYAVMLTWIRGIHPDRIELLGTQLHFNISGSV